MTAAWWGWFREGAESNHAAELVDEKEGRADEGDPVSVLCARASRRQSAALTVCLRLDVEVCYRTHIHTHTHTPSPSPLSQSLAQVSAFCFLFFFFFVLKKKRK